MYTKAIHLEHLRFLSENAVDSESCAHFSKLALECAQLIIAAGCPNPPGFVFPPPVNKTESVWVVPAAEVRQGGETFVLSPVVNDNGQTVTAPPASGLGVGGFAVAQSC